MSDYREVARNTATDDQLQAAYLETQECGYVVTPGYRYCRGCGGTGGINDRFMRSLPCPACDAEGEVPAA